MKIQPRARIWVKRQAAGVKLARDPRLMKSHMTVHAEPEKCNISPLFGFGNKLEAILKHRQFIEKKFLKRLSPENLIDLDKPNSFIY